MNLVSLLVSMVFSTRQSRDSSTAEEDLIRSQIPLRISDVFKRFNLDAKTTTYAMCPSCHKGHPPTFRHGSSEPVYPTHCNNVLLEKGTCGQALLDNEKKPQPIKPFVYHHVDDFVGSLLAREDLETYIDSSCDELLASVKDEETPMFVHDVMQASFMRSFQGHDKKLFIDRGDEGRLAFALSVDNYTVEGLRTRGSKASCGMIGMACLNLPYDIRYKPENMYLVGIIPGPIVPHNAELNHYLAPLVDDMKVSYHNGVSYSRTALYPNGRTVRSAIVVEICDLVGARSLAGLMPATSNHPCSVCNLQPMDQVGRCDHETWQMRDVEELRHIAKLWQSATTLGDQAKIYSTHGVRYSVLWELEYWDPTRQLVVDPMHCIFENMVDFHVRDVLQLTSEAAKAKKKTPSAFFHNFRKPLLPDNADYESLPEIKKLKKAEIDAVRLIHGNLTQPLVYKDEDQCEECFRRLHQQIESRSKKALRFVCDDLGLPLKDDAGLDYKSFLTAGIVQWVSSVLIDISSPN
jgi:hypothetical protein